MSSTDLELAIIRQVVVSYDFINHIFRFRGKVGFRTVALPSHFFLLNRSTDKESARSIKRYELEYCVYNENNILLPMYICTVCCYIPTCVKDLLSTWLSDRTDEIGDTYSEKWKFSTCENQPKQFFKRSTLRSQFKVAYPEQGCFRTFLVTIGIARRNFGSVLVFSSTNITMKIVSQSAYCIEW